MNIIGLLPVPDSLLVSWKCFTVICIVCLSLTYCVFYVCN